MNLEVQGLLIISNYKSNANELRRNRRENYMEEALVQT